MDKDEFAKLPAEARIQVVSGLIARLSATLDDKIEHLLMPGWFANEVGARVRLRRESGTANFLMAWCKNGRALYVQTPELEGVGDARA